MEKIEIDPEIIATCNALGHIDENTGKYEKDPDCEACLRDLIRFLRRDGSNFVIRRQLGQTNVVTNDLIPLLKDHCLENKELFDIVIRLLMNLTNPAILLFKEEVPTEKDRKVLFLELLELTYTYKVAFASNLKCWAVFAKWLMEITSQDWEDRQEEDRMLFERVLITIRNLLHVPLDTYHDTAINEDMNPHDRLLCMMDSSGVTDLILLLVSNEDEYHYCFHVLEILSLMLREQEPEFLALSYDTAKNGIEGGDSQVIRRSAFERNRDDEELELLINREKSSRRPKGTYRRFKETTYQIKNLKSLSDRDMIYHKPVGNGECIALSEGKAVKKKAKNQRSMRDADFGGSDFDELKIHKSVPRVRNHLGRVCHELLPYYNVMMQTVKDSLLRKKNQDHDETYYLWASFFLMEFNRAIKTDVSLVSETYSTDALHYFHTLIMDYIDHLKVEKKNYLPWSRRLHYAVKAYRELICSLSFMSSSDDYQFHETTMKLKRTAFYEEEYRELLVFLLKEYNCMKMSRKFLIDLVNTNHVFLRLFKSYCVVNEKIVVKKKGKKKPKRRKKSKKVIQAEAEKWEDMTLHIQDALKGYLELPTADQDEDVLPMDSTVDFDPEQQKTSIVKRISRLLHDEKPLSAVALLKNARQAWIDDPEFPFGRPEATVEEDEATLKEIYEADFLEEEPKNEAEDGKEEVVMTETTLNFSEFFKKYCVPRVVIPHVILLKDYNRNKPGTNHAVVKFLHRLGFEFGSIGMLFQSSIFRIFQRILKEPVSDEWSKELRDFAVHTVRKFVEIFPKNDKILIELLFWKNAKEGGALEEGYEDQTTGKHSPDRGTPDVLSTLSDQEFLEKDIDDNKMDRNYLSKEIISDDESSSESEKENLNDDPDLLLDNEKENAKIPKEKKKLRKKRLKTSIFAVDEDSNKSSNSKNQEEEEKVNKSPRPSDESDLDGDAVEKLFASDSDVSDSFYDKETDKEDGDEDQAEVRQEESPEKNNTIRKILEPDSENEEDSSSKRPASDAESGDRSSPGVKKKRRYNIESDDDE